MVSALVAEEPVVLVSPVVMIAARGSPVVRLPPVRVPSVLSPPFQIADCR